MSNPAITYVFKDNITFAIREGKVVASSADPDEVEALVKQAYGDPGYGMGPEQPMMGGGMPDPAMQEPRCENCDGTREECERGGCGPGRFTPAGSVQNPDPGNPMYDNPYAEPGLGQPDPYTDMDRGYQAKVVTPSGLKGTVLGKVAGLWGDEVTVRLENGRIVKLPTGTELRSVKTAAAPRVNPIAGLEARLNVTPDGTRGSLVQRASDLVGLRKHAADLIREGVSYADSLRLDQLVVTAEVEQAEIVEAIAHLDDVESYQPPTYSIGAAHTTAGVSREDASWLDHTLDDMIKEAEATDFTKLMDEGPEAFIAEQPDVALADTGVTREMASSFISEKTAGIVREVAEPYMDTFLARVEECRRAELAGRKQTTHKEAAATEDKYKDLPDDSLFL